MKLFAEFPPISTDDWMSVVTRDLKGEDFEKRLVTKTLDGLKLKPFYRREDLAVLDAGTRLPLRGWGNRWTLREEIREPDIDEANQHIRRCLERGVDEVAVYTYPLGPAVRSAEDVGSLLKGVWLDAVAIHWLAGPLAAETLALVVNEAYSRETGLDELQGSVDLDPILDRCAGWTEAPMETWKDDFYQVARFVLGAMPKYKLLSIRGALIEKAGASIAQELAFTLSLLVEYLTEAGELYDAGKLGAGQTRAGFLSDIIRRSELRFGIGTNYFLEIGKLRAARLLIRKLLDTFRVDDAMPTIQAITTSSNKTLYDPYNNVLRATIESVAAVVGGADSLSVAAYDQGYHSPDEFSEHLSRNTQNVLCEEAYLDKVADPLAGSYSVEVITHSYAQAAWDLFLKVEDKGGFVSAWQEGFIGRELARIRTEREKQVARRQRKIVGTTNYSNPDERRLQDVRSAPKAFQLAHVKPAPIEDLVAKAVRGVKVAGPFTTRPVPSTPLDPFRPSWPFENLRLRVERFVASGGKRPRVLLAMWGDKKMRRARSGFCQSFFAAGGYQISEQVIANPVDLARISREQGIDLIVLCSSDDEVLEMAKSMVRGAVDPMPVVTVAGNPEPVLESLKALGIWDFVHVRTDILQSLAKYHELFGIPEIPLDQPLIPEEK